jgi:hypothetical protein
MRQTLLIDTGAAVIDRYVTAAEAALILGVEIETLRTWRVRKQGPRYRKFGRLIRYGLADLRSYADAGIIEHNHAPGQRVCA